MELPVNGFKRALAEGRAQIGLWCALPGGYAAEVMAGAGFDWLLLDTEHRRRTRSPCWAAAGGSALSGLLRGAGGLERYRAGQAVPRRGRADPAHSLRPERGGGAGGGGGGPLSAARRARRQHHEPGDGVRADRRLPAAGRERALPAGAGRDREALGEIEAIAAVEGSTASSSGRRTWPRASVTPARRGTPRWWRRSRARSCGSGGRAGPRDSDAGPGLRPALSGTRRALRGGGGGRGAPRARRRRWRGSSRARCDAAFQTSGRLSCLMAGGSARGPGPMSRGDGAARRIWPSTNPTADAPP